MSAWLAAVAAGLLFATVQYGRLIGRERPRPLGLALLRFAAVTLLVALLLDVRVGADVPPPPLVALDASQSLTRGDSTRWHAAVARARALAGDSLLLIGDSLRLAGEDVRPTDHASSIAALLDHAGAQGRPVVVITDGEIPAGEAAAADALPRGSRFEVVAGTAHVDAALVEMDTPRTVAGGDTLRVVIAVRTGSAPAPPSRLTLLLDGRLLAAARLDGLGAHAMRAVTLSAPMGKQEGQHVLRAVVAAPGDVEARNDTLGVALEVSADVRAVWISSAPDLDGRAALSVLRGALAIPTQAFLRVTPGTWVVEGSFARVSEGVVRQAAQDASMLILHGDTAVFGPPRALAGLAPLALLPGPGDVASASSTSGALDEWYPTAAPPSPAAAALAGVAWDSLAPVSLGNASALPVSAEMGGWVAVAGRHGRRGAVAPLVVGSESRRRVVTSRATGFWRWTARGGAGTVAYAGLWGSLFDWLADGRRDRRVAVPEHGSVRAGRPLTWRISAPGDSPTPARLVPRNESGGARTVMLQRAAGTIFAQSPPLLPGVYDVETRGGRSLIVVNASEELLPRQPVLKDGPRGRGAVAGAAPALRDHGVAYALVIVLLCVEWVLRRRRGLQ